MVPPGLLQLVLSRGKFSQYPSRYALRGMQDRIDPRPRHMHALPCRPGAPPHTFAARAARPRQRLDLHGQGQAALVCATHTPI